MTWSEINKAVEQESQRLNLLKGSIRSIFVTLLCGALWSAQGQGVAATTAKDSELASGLSATGALSVEQVKSNGQSERERLLLKQGDKHHGERVKSDVRVSIQSGSDSNDAITNDDSSLSPTGTVGKLPVEGESKPSAQEPPNTSSDPQWHYGGFFDLGYLLDFNHPANHLFRSRGTAFRVDSVFLNMAAFYVRKKATEQSRWGLEATAQAGKDAEFFGFSATAPNIAGFKFLRQLGPTNVSYLAPVDKGLTLQAGIFSSLIGYDSLYAKDNLNYTRPWGADFTPYFMMGANASYPFTEKLTGTFFVVNGYWHLARANNVPSSGGQIAYKVNPRVTVKETVLFGPHQANKSFKFWRFLTDTIVERKTDRVTLAFEYIYSQERVDTPGSPRALMMASQLPVRWTMNKRWSISFRPEVFWDRDGRWTLARQTVKAFTTTLEYRLPYRWTNTIFRMEHRFDDSRGPDGGFFRGREVQPGVVGLTPSQHLLIFATIFTFDR
jgi:Putative beta-barrel porin-2, OmpL-like. bbp2